MLPYFNVTLAERLKMSNPNVPPRNQRKKVDVPIHRTQTDSKDVIHKTYSANFNSRKKQKSVEFSDLNIIEATDTNLNVALAQNAKPSRKILQKEIERLSKENEELLKRLAGTDTICSKKISRMKEKLTVLQDHYNQIENENYAIKKQYQELLTSFEEIKNEIEKNRQCEKCEHLKSNLVKTTKEYNLLRGNNKDLLEDIAMLKNVVYRLNVQMERYQEKLRKLSTKPKRREIHIQQNNASDVAAHHFNPEAATSGSNGCISQASLPEDHVDHHHTPVSWGKVNAHTLGPLLDAYQDTIDEKDDIIATYERELSNFTGKMKEIIKENEHLHQRLTEDDNCSQRLMEQLDKVATELKSVKEQNEILVKKCAIKQNKVEEILRCYEQKVEQLQRDYKVVHEEYIRSRSEIVALKEKNKALLEAKEEFKHEKENYIPLSVHAASVNECKRLYEELKEQYQNEKQILKGNISTQNKEILELNTKISVVTNEKEELENKIKALEKHIKKGEAKYLDLQHTLNEIQLSRSACRKQLHKAMSFAKDLVAEQETLLKALNQRQHENKIVKKLGTDMAARMDSLKTQLKNVQKDAWQELTTVEQRLNDQNSLILAMKQEHSEEVDRLNKIIKRTEKISGGDEISSIPTPHYLLFREKNINQ